MKLLTPILPERMDLITEDSEFIKEKKEYEEPVRDVLLKNINMTEEDLSDMRFQAVRFENCLFMDCSFRKGEFTDVVFQSCNFSNCNFSDSYFNRVEFRSFKGLGARFSGSSIYHMSIKDCNLAYGNFDACKLEHLLVEDSELEHGNITQCRCKDVSWNRVKLTNASFFKTSMKKMDFTTSVIQGLVLSDDCSEVKGAVVDLYQAAELAKYLGVIVKE